MRTAYFNGPQSQILSMAAKQAGLECRDAKPQPFDAQALQLNIDSEMVSSKYAVLPSDGYKIVVTPNEPVELIANSQRSLAYGLMDFSDGQLDLQNSTEYSPSMAIRSFHLWLPFALGQTYGGEGYSAWEMRTDWWWYDRDYWIRFFRGTGISAF